MSFEINNHKNTSGHRPLYNECQWLDNMTNIEPKRRTSTSGSAPDSEGQYNKPTTLDVPKPGEQAKRTEIPRVRRSKLGDMKDSISEYVRPYIDATKLKFGFDSDGAGNPDIYHMHHREKMPSMYPRGYTP
ncbi:hypothetical protein AAVH_29279 [Aphelenchoides avenae]|nr:hypothetical protein AAVH_29279 [Aphelenchus avenae]